VNNSRYLSPKQRRQRNREEMTAAILQTARDIMSEQGVAALNLNEIARRLGMQTPSLYEYFPNKMALYDHLFRLGTRLFTEQLLAAAAQPDLSAWDQIEQSLTAYLQCAVDNPELFKLVYERHVPGFVPSDESMSEAIAALEAGSRQILSFVQSAELDTALTIEQMRDIFIVLVHGITALHLANNPDQPVGTGRFGGLLPQVMEILKKAWSKEPE
jgi:AcrR family transcriptional regulator